MRSNDSAIAGEMPAFPLSRRDNACRVQPSSAAASVTDSLRRFHVVTQNLARMAGVQHRHDSLASLVNVVHQIHVDRFAVLETEHHAPIP